jgi:outer membrane protein OmpA-like peptidoglycan-associated protein
MYARLAYNMNMGWRGGLIIGAGVVRSDYGFIHAFGANGLVGVRVGIIDRLQVRVDGLMDYHGKSEPEATTNLSARIGLSFLPGPSDRARVRNDEPRGPRDLDADGITDDMDECKDTPAGVRVDARGCTLPVDSDGDGVVDAADRCPGTPSGTSVDSSGCPTVAPPAPPSDSDRDGVADPSDRCPGTLPGMAVDANGCPVQTADADADGIPDATDRCAATPVGTRVDVFGCPVPSDADNDGVVDANDRCPNTPAGSTVDTAGCPPPPTPPPAPSDADKDGVADASDRCPETSPGFAVDAAGCPNDFKEGFSSVVLRGVTFESGRSTLTPGSSSILDAVANILKTSGQRVEIAGHTDNSGSATTNNNISQSRAMAVRSYLISKGVPAAQLLARGYGSKEPIADNSTEEGKAANRRVELRKM